MGAFLSQGSGRRGLVLLAVVAVVVTVALVPASAQTREVNGEFRSTRVAPCAPTPICTEGRATGDINGRFTLTGTSVIPTAATPSTGVLAYTAEVVITTRNGTLNCRDTGVTRPVPDAGAASSICVVTSGTGIYEGASGYIQFQSRFIPPDRFSGTYTGRLTGVAGQPGGGGGGGEDRQEERRERQEEREALAD